MSLPLIGVTTSLVSGQPRERLRYFHAVERAGGAPVLLAPGLDDALRKRMDGLLLSGGGDVDPARYGEPRHPKTGDVSEARDELEIELVRRAVSSGLPVLAICRGVQVLNVALGGSLIQDIPSETGSRIIHSQPEPRDAATHRVGLIEETSRLGGITGATELVVNSFHHQAIKRPGHGLRAVARAEDGIIECVEPTEGDAFLLGVQWHPEEMIELDAASRSLFSAFVAASAARRLVKD